MNGVLRAPWTVERSVRYAGLFDVYDCDGNPIVNDKTEGVARLIATAPETVAERDRLRAVNTELLTALRYIVEWNNETWDPEKARDLARAAIAKATAKE